jgi:hypothetical protein
MMGYRLVDTGWDRELSQAMKSDSKQVRIVCPFIKKCVVERLLKTAKHGTVQVITRFNLSDFAEGVSDIDALRYLLERGAQVRGVRNLHAKLYLFGTSRAIVTSANLTNSALLHNHELGFVAEGADIVKQCSDYFTSLWSRAGRNLTVKRLNGWEEIVTRHLATGGNAASPSGLGDEGEDAGITAEGLVVTPWQETAPQAFVKFLGTGNKRESLSVMTFDQILSSGCHWALAYPDKKRPTGVKDGALMFIGRMTKEPNDIRVFGKAIAMRYEPGRDDATPADIARRSWKKIWPRYVRVHHAEFVSGSMDNGVSLNELMAMLKAKSFVSTQRNFEKGYGNIDPRKAYQQQAAVELTPQGLAWLNARLEESFAMHGKLKLADSGLDWPKLPAR